MVRITDFLDFGMASLLKLCIDLCAEIMIEEGEEPGEVQVVEVGAVSENKFKQIFRSKIVHYMALFSIIYIGVEVTMGGEFCLSDSSPRHRSHPHK